MQTSELSKFRLIFIAAAIWNLCGGILGYVFTEQTFVRLFDDTPIGPVTLSMFQGATGTTLTYFFGYLIVATNPLRHTGVVIIGTIGKIGFAIQLWKFYAAGLLGCLPAFQLSMNPKPSV
jgi:hypothetical protein